MESIRSDEVGRLNLKKKGVKWGRQKKRVTWEEAKGKSSTNNRG